MRDEPLRVKVWGEYACFTRPEMKVERVSYPVMTPSAARGVLEAIFWKPEFQWRIREIHVLKPLRHIALLRNEVDRRIPVRGAQPFFADESRAQRHTLALRDVAYIIVADIVLQPHADKDIAAYRDQFQRRVERGQCYRQPYLGCREFAAHFAPPSEYDHAIDWSDDWDACSAKSASSPTARRNPSSSTPNCAAACCMSRNTSTTEGTTMLLQRLVEYSQRVSLPPCLYAETRRRLAD
jgi:CRISPR-associated protein Cas5d